MLVAVLEVACRAGRRPAPSPERSVAAAGIATAVVFAAIKLSEPAGAVFQVAFGWLRWPLSAVESWIEGDGFSARAHVELVRDPTDLVALPMVVVAWLVHGRRPSSGDRR